MPETVIKVDNLSKRYVIRHAAQKARYATLRDTLAYGVRNVASRFRHSNAMAPTREEFWAIKDVSFEVKRGEVVGIIGRNGAGKSTLLKILSRITEPTRGRIEIDGRVASLLEVGTGFHPELTGRENIFLNGSILGMGRLEIKRKLDEIVAFAEVDRFLDTPVKRYSSGMYVRLAFAVAAHLEPEILIVDEVLAVGDIAFQKKCLGKMEQSARRGRTVLFVSHNMGAIQGLCRRAVLLEEGVVRADDKSDSVVNQYLESLCAGFTIEDKAKTDELLIRRVVLRNGKGVATTTLEFGDQLAVEVHFEAFRRIPSPYFWISISSQFGTLFGSNMLLDGKSPPFLEGVGTVTCVFKDLCLLPQTYTLAMGVRSADTTTSLLHATEIGAITIRGTAADLGLEAATADSFISASAPMLVPYEWHYPNGQVVTVSPRPHVNRMSSY